MLFRLLLAISILVVIVQGIGSYKKPAPKPKPSYKPSSKKCPTDGRRGVLCGHVGISRTECLKDCNCCYNRNIKRCYFKSNVVGKRHNCCCNIRPQYREECCGDKSLNSKPNACRQMGCCYAAKQNSQTKRCYKPRVDCCEMLSNQIGFPKVDAGYPGIKEEKCTEWPNSCWKIQRGRAYCFFKWPPCHCPSLANYRRDKCCDPSGFDLEEEPAVCRAYGCCFNARHGRRPRCYREKKIPKYT